MAETGSGLVRRVQAGGIRLAYRTWGAAEAPPVVLLHALGEESSDWAPVATALASSWRVYAPDLRGHGASDWPGSYTIEQLTMDLAAFLDALGLDQVTLGGHSAGGPPAYLYAARHPDRVTRLVLEDPAPPWPRARRDAVLPGGPHAQHVEIRIQCLCIDKLPPGHDALGRRIAAGTRPGCGQSKRARPDRS